MKYFVKKIEYDSFINSTRCTIECVKEESDGNLDFIFCKEIKFIIDGKVEVNDIQSVIQSKI